MAVHVIRKGLDLPLAGEPGAEVDASKQAKRVAVVAADYLGMRPTLLVQVGDTVKRGQPLFENKKVPGVVHTAPGAGILSAVNRGARRAFQTAVIDLNDNEQAGEPADADFHPFSNHTDKDLALLTGEEVRALLVESGLWTALRTRPYGKQPAPDSQAKAIFITAMDTNPLAPPIDTIADGRQEDLDAGVLAVAKLTDGYVYYCTSPDAKTSPPPNAGIKIETFKGPHPSGTAGLHIHQLQPVGRDTTVWHIGLQDVLAIGALVRTGRLDVSRVVSLAGPGVARPRLLETRMGACIDDLVEGELKDGEMRVLSGSVLSGRAATGEIHGYLGHYHNQITVLREGREREFLGWMSPGLGKFSISRLFPTKLFAGKKYALNTSTNGSDRAIVPIGLYEKVMPLDILPTFLLRALAMQDLERAEALGCLELDEEDLALCTFVCPGKTDYGPLLRSVLEAIEKEG